MEFKDQKIVEVGMEKEVKKSFIEYSMSVIAARALPDVRDGMKPGQRRIMYAMYEDHLTYDKPFRKSATTVGNVLGRYHPHGDSAVYGTMVRMAQDFSYRYPLVQGHGNFGSVDGDGAAAYRYTEARMSKISDELMKDLEKEVVDFVPNFDNRLREPKVLPSRFPNLLVNGAVGIAVGMATNIPPHNLGEVIDATIYRMDNPESTVADLMQYVHGPDFPTSATIYGVNGIIQAYTTGRGRVMVRAKAEVEEDKRRIIITEIPYGVNKSLLCEAIAGLVKDKRIEGITELRDESGRDGMRIVVEYRRDANGQVILNQLYKYSQLEDTCAINMLALVNNEPKVLSLPQILDHYIAHQKSVIYRRVQFDLEKAKNRAHIFEGYHIAIDNIDRIIEIMKTSRSIPEAKERLMAEFFTVSYKDGYESALGNVRQLSDAQAQAIVEMTLGKLTGMERDKIEEELARLHGIILELEGILADPQKIVEIIREEMTEIKRKYSDARRTEIIEATDDIELEDLIEKHNCVITITHAGYIKRIPADTYSAQRRGGKGIIGMTTKEEDFIENVIALHSHSYLLMFTNKGKIFVKKAYQIPEASRTAKGTNIVNIIETEPDEKITSVISIADFGEGGYLTMVTRNGVIKKTLLKEYEYQRKGGKRALNLDEGDELLFVMHTDGEKSVIIATENGAAVKFSEANVRPMGRTARGVRGISLRDGDRVTGVAVVEEGKQLVTVTQNGYGKRTEFDDFREMKNRGGFGVVCHNLTEKTGKLCSIATVCDDDDLMMITDSGTIIRTPVDGIPTYSRSAGGVIVMRLAEGQTLVNFTKVAKEEEEPEEADQTVETVEAAETTEE
ncbi:MAG: DNA gyrase subunit A [Clostridia bacterium]|nr:DNA gyrase subunit A [Clostridia bacterium]MBR6679684.1 DNA gyrase subunit A [Clostridia bacterium]